MLTTIQKYGGVTKGYVCPACGKYFFVPFQSKGGGKTQWAYRRRVKNRMLYFCSYGCYQSGIKK